MSDDPSRRNLLTRSIPHTRRTTYTLAAVIAVGAFVRVMYLGTKSYWWDEVATVKLCHLPFSLFRSWVWQFEANGSFYYLLLRPWIRFSDHEVWVRLASVLPAVAAIPVIYLVGRRMSGNNTGLAAAFLLSLNVAHIAYAQEARFYSLVVFLCSLSLLLFLRIPHNGSRNIMAYAVVSALACYSHFFAVFFLFAQWSATRLSWRQLPWRKVLVAISLTLLLIAPALYYMAFRNKGQLAFVPRPHLHDLISLAYFLTADGGKFRKPLAAIYALGCAIAVAGLLLPWRTQKQRDWPLTVVVACLALPIAITFVISFWMPIFYPRYLLICLPGLVLLAARGLVEITPSWIRAGVAVLIVALSAGCLHWYYSHPKDDWRSLTAYLLKNSKPGDTIVGCPPGAEWPVQYYAAVLSSQNPPRFSYVTPSVLLKDIHDRETNLSRVWIVAWHDNQQMRTVEREIAPEYTPVDDQVFYGELSLVLYENYDGKMSRKAEASASNK